MFHHFLRDQRHEGGAGHQRARLVFKQLHHVEGLFQNSRHGGAQRVLEKTQGKQHETRAPRPRLGIPRQRGALRGRSFPIAPRPHRTHSQQRRDGHAGDFRDALAERHPRHILRLRWLPALPPVTRRKSKTSEQITARIPFMPDSITPGRQSVHRPQITAISGKRLRFRIEPPPGSALRQGDDFFLLGFHDATRLFEGDHERLRIR